MSLEDIQLIESIIWDLMQKIAKTQDQEEKECLAAVAVVLKRVVINKLLED